MIIDESIQIVDGCLTCPHCAGDVEVVAVVGIGLQRVTPCFKCLDCGERFGMDFVSCGHGHTHIHWVNIPDDDAMAAENGTWHTPSKDLN